MERPFARALGYFPRVRREWLSGMAWILPSAGCPLAAFWLVSQIVDSQDTGSPSPALAWITGWLGPGAASPDRVAAASGFILLLVLLGAWAKYRMRYLITGASRHFERLFRQDLFEHLMSLSGHDLAALRTGDIMSRSVADVEAVRMFLGPGVMYVSQAFVVVPAALVAMALVDPMLMLTMLVPFAGLALVIKIAARPTQRWSQATQEQLAEVSTVAQESFAGIRVVKAFATEPLAAASFRGMGRGLLTANLRLATLRGATSAGIHAAKELGVLAILLLGGWHIVQGRLSDGGLMLFLMLLGYALWPLIAIGWMLGMYHRARVAAQRLEELFALQPSVHDSAPGSQTGTDPASIPPPGAGHLEVRRLSFAWADGPPVLADVSLDVPPGTTLGLTGRTGCGKSTLVQLLARLVEPPPGTVLLDGQDIREVPLARLRATIGVVPQDTFLFSESIRSNIAFADDDLDDEAVRAAARMARVDADIEGFDQGYDQLLGERGVTLSGGQRQRTAIARTLAADPPVIILDDCLSAVDSVTEQEILANLRQTLAGRTALVVSHRVAALSLADQVVVLDEGRVVEQGSPDELLAAGGLYAEIAERQRLAAEIEAELEEL